MSSNQVCSVVQNTSEAGTSDGKHFSNIQNKFEAGMSAGNLFFKLQNQLEVGGSVGKIYSEFSKVQGETFEIFLPYQESLCQSSL